MSRYSELHVAAVYKTAGNRQSMEHDTSLFVQRTRWKRDAKTTRNGPFETYLEARNRADDDPQPVDADALAYIIKELQQLHAELSTGNEKQ